MPSTVTSIKIFATRYSHVNWALADQAMVSGVNFLTGILFARYLGLEEFGRFTLAWMAVLFCNSFQQAGIIAPMMSLGPKQKAEDEPAYYGAVIVQQVIWSVACFFLLWGGVWLSGYIKPAWNIQGLGLPLAAALLAWQLQDFLRRYFFVRGQGRLAFINDAVSYLGQLALLALFFRLTTLNTVHVLWLIAGTSALAVFIGVWQFGPFRHPHKDLGRVTARHWRLSKWLIASALSQWTSSNFFMLIGGAVLGPGPVGVFKAIQNVFGVITVIFQALENILPIRIVNKVQHSGAASALVYIDIFFFKSFILIAIVIAGFTWWSGNLFSFLYDSNPHGVPVYFGLFGISILSLHAINMHKYFFRAIEKTKIIFIANLFSSISMIFFAKIIVDKFGEIGLFLLLNISNIIMILTFLLYRRRGLL